METDAVKALENVFHEILGKYALMFGDPAGAGEFTAFKGSFVEATIDFIAPRNGTLHILAPEGFCNLLSANVLGTDPEDFEAINNSQDSLKEFGNLTCGHFVTSFFGSSRPSDLKPPQVRRLEKQEAALEEGKATVRFTVDGFPVAAYVDLL